MTNPFKLEWSEVRQVGLSRVLRRGHLCSQTLPFWSKAAFWAQSGGLTLGQLLNPNPWGGVRRHERFAVGRRWFRNAERFGRCGPRGVGRFQLRRKVCLGAERRKKGCRWVGVCGGDGVREWRTELFGCGKVGGVVGDGVRRCG